MQRKISELEGLLNDPNKLSYAFDKAVQAALDGLEEYDIGLKSGVIAQQPQLVEEMVQKTINYCIDILPWGPRIAVKALLRMNSADAISTIYEGAMEYCRKEKANETKLMDFVAARLKKYVGA